MTSLSVLLISANTETVPYATYPVALARLSDAVARAGHSAHQYDLLVSGREALSGAIAAARPDLIGISLRNIDNTDADDARSYVGEYADLVAAIRAETDAPLVLGGSGYSLFARPLQRALDAEFGVVGPGEETLCALLNALAGDGDVSRIPNLLTRDGGGPRAPSVPCTSRLGPNRYEGALVEYYWRVGGMIGLQTKRGCPGRCIYCTYPLIEGRTVQRADVGQVVDEIERLVTDWDVRYFFMVDSIFNLDAEHERALAEEICRRDLAISWGAFFAPTRMDRDYLEVLRRSGLTHVEFGTDSLCDPVLETARKDFAVDEVMRVSSLCARLAVHYAHYLIFGLPGETRDTIRETIRHAASLKGCAFFPFAGARVYPGTALCDIARREGRIDPDDDLLTPRFYFAPGLDSKRIWGIVGEAASGRERRRRWVLPSRFRTLMPFVRDLRARGAKGPLWDRLIG